MSKKIKNVRAPFDDEAFKNMGQMKFGSLLRAFMYFHNLDDRIKENPYRFIELAVFSDCTKLGMSNRDAFSKAQEMTDMVMYLVQEAIAERLPAPDRAKYQDEFTGFGIGRG
jgi:hypothetical protein